MCGASANRCSPRVIARPSMRGQQVGPDVQPPAPRSPEWRTTLLGAPRGKTALMALESCSLMTRQQWTAAGARRCAQMAWPWETQHLRDVVQPTMRMCAAYSTSCGWTPFCPVMKRACLCTAAHSSISQLRQFRRGPPRRINCSPQRDYIIEAPQSM